METAPSCQECQRKDTLLAQKDAALERVAQWKERQQDRIAELEAENAELTERLSQQNGHRQVDAFGDPMPNEDDYLS